MLKNMTYQEKFSLLNPWMPEIIDQVKKDLRQDHLRRDLGFVKQYFANKNPAKITLEELVKGYVEGLQNREISEELGEFISNRWLLKNTDLYYFFEENLKKLTADFESLSEIETAFANRLSDESSQLFGPMKTYLFVVMNSVVFPEATLTTLKQKAEGERLNNSAREEENNEIKSWQDKERQYLTQISRLEDKYQKKILGLQRKYEVDIEALKKQISQLQRKASEVRAESETVPVSNKSTKR